MKIYHIGLCATPGTNNGLQRAFKKVSEYKEIFTGHPNLNNQIIQDVSDFRPDLIFMQIQTPNIIQVETLRKIRPFCGKIINFTGDVRSPLPEWYIEVGKVIDLTLFVSMNDVRIARTKGIKADWLQLGFDETIFNYKVKPAKVPDIVFMANNYDQFPLSQYRRDIVKALSKEFKEKFQLYGNGWTTPCLDSNSSMEGQASILRGCKIAINCSNYNHSMYSSDRLIRIMGAGAFCLSHNFIDYDKVYTDGKDIAIFDSIPEMIELCHAYLEDEEERNRVARNGYELTHKLYTWDSMIKNLLLCV